MTSLHRALSVAIIGGGPGGLTLARILQRNGINPRVFEREASVNERSQGGTLDLHRESGLKALRDAGLLGEFMAHARFEGDAKKFMDKTGKVHFEYLPAAVKSIEDPYTRPEIDRYVHNLHGRRPILQPYISLGKTYAPSSSIRSQRTSFSGAGQLKVWSSQTTNSTLLFLTTTPRRPMTSSSVPTVPGPSFAPFLHPTNQCTPA